MPTSIAYPTGFLSNLSLPPSFDDVPRVKLFGAEFFVQQLRTLWNIAIPSQFPERYVFASTIDAIIGEIYSSKDALRQKLAIEIKNNGLKHYKRDIYLLVQTAEHNNNWLSRIIRLRNSGLHGNLLPEALFISLPAPPSGALTDMRLVGYEHGIVKDAFLPDVSPRSMQQNENLNR